MKYRKKPVVIEAWEFLQDEEIPDWIRAVSVEDAHDWDWEIPIKTLEGTMVAKLGDFIIRGVKGEVYPCKPDIFEATYERAE